MAKEIISCERIDGIGTKPETAYCVAYFHDKDYKCCNKEDAYYVNIMEFDKNDRRVQEFYGIVNHKPDQDHTSADIDNDWL